MISYTWYHDGSGCMISWWHDTIYTMSDHDTMAWYHSHDIVHHWTDIIVLRYDITCSSHNVRYMLTSQVLNVKPQGPQLACPYNVLRVTGGDRAILRFHGSTLIPSPRRINPCKWMWSSGSMSVYQEYDITYNISKYISTYIMTYTFRVFPRNRRMGCTVLASEEWGVLFYTDRLSMRQLTGLGLHCQPLAGFQGRAL